MKLHRSFHFGLPRSGMGQARGRWQAHLCTQTLQWSPLAGSATATQGTCHRSSSRRSPKKQQDPPQDRASPVHRNVPCALCSSSWPGFYSYLLRRPFANGWERHETTQCHLSNACPYWKGHSSQQVHGCPLNQFMADPKKTHSPMKPSLSLRLKLGMGMSTAGDSNLQPTNLARWVFCK